MPPPPPKWPRWLVLLASLPIIYHLGSVILSTASAPSGPWMTADGPSLAIPPLAASLPHEYAAVPYLSAVKLTHNYHFASNRPGEPDAYLEVRLEDEEGKALKTVRVPDPDAPLLVRQRQAMLMRWLVDDQPVTVPPGMERIPAPGQEPPRLNIWEGNEPGKLTIREISELEIPRNRMAFRPTEWSLVVVRSCARHLCRTHGAAKAQVIRHSRNAVHHSALLAQQTPPIEELVSDYGRFPK